MAQKWFGSLVACALAVGAHAGASSPVVAVAVAPGTALQAAVDAAAPGATLRLAPGIHHGPVTLSRPLSIEAEPGAIIASSGAGSTVQVESSGVTLRGLRIDGSGGRFDLLDAAIRIRGDDVLVEGARIENALFGILVEQSNRVVLRANRIVGQADRPLGMRGDGIRLWEVRESVIEDNRLEDGRDLVVWYSPGNRFTNNVALRGRYGAHLMYSHHNRIEGNRFDGNVVGMFLMYSRHVEVVDNWILRSAGAAGVGLGAKESGALDVRDNHFLGNATGLYLDNSPLDRTLENRFEGNRIRFGDAGIVFHGVVERNSFLGNDLLDNRVTVRVDGGGDALAATWRGNHFDDYRGYDLDGDRVGDFPFELRSLVGEMSDRKPALRMFEGTLALAMVERIGRVVPMLRPRLLLVDAAPRVTPLAAREREIAAPERAGALEPAP